MSYYWIWGVNTESLAGGVYSTEKEKENCLHKALNVHLSPRDINCFVDQQMIIKKENYLSQKKIPENKEKWQGCVCSCLCLWYQCILLPTACLRVKLLIDCACVNFCLRLAYAPTNDSIFCIFFAIYAIHVFYFYHYSGCIMLSYLILISTFLITIELNSSYMFIWPLWYN